MKKDENRLYIQWNVKSRDGKELKVYIEIGCTAGLKPAKIREKIPQFKTYTYSAFNLQYISAQKSYNNQIWNRGSKSSKA